MFASLQDLNQLIDNKNCGWMFCRSKLTDLESVFRWCCPHLTLASKLNIDVKVLLMSVKRHFLNQPLTNLRKKSFKLAHTENQKQFSPQQTHSRPTAEHTAHRPDTGRPERPSSARPACRGSAGAGCWRCRTNLNTAATNTERLLGHNIYTSPDSKVRSNRGFAQKFLCKCKKIMSSDHPEMAQR